ncbi:MAG: methylmalonyl-CoA mutase family protein, partial [Metallibacterium sp.]
MFYERKKHDGSLPLVGVNTYLPREHAGEIATSIELIRSTEDEKRAQIEHVRSFQQARNAVLHPSPSGRRPTEVPKGGEGGEGSAQPNTPGSLTTLQTTARERRNLFEQLMQAVKYNSLGQISHALYEVGGEYRRNM